MILEGAPVLKSLTCLLAVATFAALPASARSLVAEQIIERVVQEKSANGKVTEKLELAERVAPGETLVYSLNFENKGPEAASDLVLVVPVPSEVTYVEKSASTGKMSVDFSADGGKTFAARDALKVRADGQMRAATADEITHIRWKFVEPIAPKQTGSLKFRATLD
jgi:uncharacterized repeat protein (TIGR01451 family)